MFTRRSFAASLGGALLFDGGFVSSAFATSLPDVLRLAMKDTTAPALGAVVIRNGIIDDRQALGLRRLGGPPEQVQSGDAWMIGSCAKPMTTALIARFVERRQLSWTDARLSAMLPDLAQTMLPVYQPVTLEQLLSHRAGLPKGDELLEEGSFADRRPLPRQRLDFLAKVLRQPPVSVPGTEPKYSNASFIAAAAIVERVGGSSYEDLMQSLIFGPLGMYGAVFGQPKDGQLCGHRDGRPSQRTESPPDFYNPAGLLRLSLIDWQKFCLDQLAGAKGRGRLLSSDSYHRMQTPLPGVANEALTWGYRPSIQGRNGPVLEHIGSDGSWYASVHLFPESGDGILLAANAGASMRGDKAGEAAVTALLPTVSTPA
jgi:CubicO group peptidase (beta-lactamase class C family)